MKTWRFGNPELAQDIPVNEDGCHFCELGAYARWEQAGDVMFVEDETGQVRRLEAMRMVEFSPGVTRPIMLCKRVTREEALAEIAANSK